MMLAPIVSLFVCTDLGLGFAGLGRYFLPFLILLLPLTISFILFIFRFRVLLGRVRSQYYQRWVTIQSELQ